MDKLEDAGYEGEVPNLRGLIDLCGKNFFGLQKTAPARGEMGERWLAKGGIGEFGITELVAHTSVGYNS